MKYWLGLLITLSTTAQAFGPVELTVWKKAETVHGEEFVAANEAVVDYIATLKRPEGITRYIKYNCQGKLRKTIINVNNNAAEPAFSWAELYTVYSLQDCVEAR